ncbi:hypothetical protein HanIR_Chr02g0088281 [Helianthus annuus]|nr:hypothetical protein HanIR_Chr02g0088281 [Helianthus annuus]
MGVSGLVQLGFKSVLSESVLSESIHGSAGLVFGSCMVKPGQQLDVRVSASVWFGCCFGQILVQDSGLISVNFRSGSVWSDSDSCAGFVSARVKFGSVSVRVNSAKQSIVVNGSTRGKHEMWLLI